MARLPTLEHAKTSRPHVVVCVHGLSGNKYDLRMVQLCLQTRVSSLRFVMSEANQVRHALHSHSTPTALRPTRTRTLPPWQGC